MKKITFEQLADYFRQEYYIDLYDVHAPLDYDRSLAYQSWHDAKGLGKILPGDKISRKSTSGFVNMATIPRVWRKTRRLSISNNGFYQATSVIRIRITGNDIAVYCFRIFVISPELIPMFEPWSAERREAEMARYFPNGPDPKDMSPWLQIREVVRRREEDPRDAAHIIKMILADYGTVKVRIERED